MSAYNRELYLREGGGRRPARRVVRFLPIECIIAWAALVWVMRVMPMYSWSLVVARGTFSQHDEDDAGNFPTKIELKKNSIRIIFLLHVLTFKVT